MKGLKEIRGKLHLTQEELGARLGVSQSAVHQYEAGKRRFPVSHAKKLVTIAKKHEIELNLEKIYG